MKKLKIWGGLLALVLLFGLAVSALANEGTSSEYSCNQDPMYTRDFNGQVTISSRLRDIPCMDESKVIRVLEKGKIVKVIAEMDGWYKIKDSDGQTGWVGATLIKSTDASVTSEKITTAPATTDTNLVSRLKGYILLQVEQKGEAWYVNPVDSFRYFLKDGDTAYNVMRDMGLGISNANLTKLKAKEASLVNRLKGRIVLQVEENGEAYYVNPQTGTLSYLKNGWEAYNVMRNLSLGIKNNDLAKIASRDVDEYKPTTTVTDTNTNSTDSKIVMTGSGVGNKANLNWTLKDMTSSMGFKVVIANHENPVYPGDEYHYLTSANVRTDSWSDLKAGTYYFRVCEYLGGKCGVYSNNVKVVIVGDDTTNDGSEGSMTLTGSLSGTKANLNWTLKDMTSSMGFKVVIANHENPVYPGDEYHYLTSANVRTDSWSDLKAGTYYFRVCEYLGGKCGVYSNNVKLIVPETVVATDGSIALSGSVNEEGIAALNWTLKDMTSSMGFKVVVADHESPVYPGDEYHYFSEANTRTDSWGDLSGTKYFRVCEYLGGKCGVYSNNLKLNF
ncbi:MAG: SH3 domain-containing protein [Candidatus Falkowbacteria bacterium]